MTDHLPVRENDPPLYSDAEFQQRLQAALAKNRTRTTARSTERAEHHRRRQYGLDQRHARKLARNQQNQEVTSDHD